MSHRSLFPALAVALGATLAASAPASAAFYVDFSTLVATPPKTIPISVTSGDNKLTFTSTDNPGSFSVGSTGGLYTGVSVGLGDFSSYSGDTLRITFAKAITGLSFNFGIEDAFGSNGGDFLTVTTGAGQSFTFNAALDSNTFQEPEGNVTFYSKTFTTVTITSGAPGALNPFVIGNISSVPEPVSLAVMGAGLLGLAGARRRA